MYPHVKLDWNISRLERRLTESPDDANARLEYARHCLSRAEFHEGGEPWFNKALTQARRILQHDPASAGALLIAGTALVGLERHEPASRYLDEALRLEPERAEVHLGLGRMFQRLGDAHQAVRELEMACRLAPDSWEAHALLGRLLAQRADELGTSRRLLERSQFHLVRALQLGPSGSQEGPILFQLALSCFRIRRIAEAHKLFNRLLNHDAHQDQAKFFLGLSAYKLGKYKNAILYLRQHLEKNPENPQVYARIGMAYLQLGEVVKAREACNRALAIEPTHLQARWTLGCAMLEENRMDDAMRMFREILSDAPDHLGAFSELLRVRRDAADLRWLRNALRSEVGIHDRLPVRGYRENPANGKKERINPRATTRDRIALILDALRTAKGPVGTTVVAILATVNLTTDEGLRFQLWDTALDMAASDRAEKVAQALQEPGLHFNRDLARQALQLATELPDTLLTQGLNIHEDDLKRAAVDRNKAAHDVETHRANVARERAEARAWQAWLLLAIAIKSNRAGKNLLLRWASDADPDLQTAALGALAMGNDDRAIQHLRQASRASKPAQEHLDRLLRSQTPERGCFRPQPVSQDSETACSMCHSPARETAHMLAGGAAAICSGCMTKLAQNRSELNVDDPTVPCTLCGKTNLQTRAVFRQYGLSVCSDCVDESLGLQERESVERYLALL